MLEPSLSPGLSDEEDARAAMAPAHGANEGQGTAGAVEIEVGAEEDGPFGDVALSPATEDGEYGEQDRDNARLMGATASSSDGRPLPSLHAPLTIRDFQFVGMFAFHVLLMLLATSFIRAEGEEAEHASESIAHLTTAPESGGSANGEDAPASLGATQLRSLCIVNVLFSVGWCMLFLYSPKHRFVQGSCAFSTVGMGVLAFALYCVQANAWATFFAVMATIVLVMDLLWLRKYKSGVDFVAVLFELVVHFLVQHPMLAYVTLGIVGFYTLWACWVCTSIGYVGHGAAPWQVSMLFLYLHFYWTSNVLKNILTVVVSGTAMMWYYKEDLSPRKPAETVTNSSSSAASPSDDESDGIASPVLESSIYPWKNTSDRQVVLHYVRCALTTSFGSICIGSLLCPIAHVLWNVLRWARRDESVLSKRFVSLRSPWVEHFIRTYHKYSFVHVAAYGKPFWVAAQDSWKLIESHGVEAIVDDDLTSRLLLFGANGWASLMCALCVSAVVHTESTEHVVFFALTSFVLAYTALSITTQVLSAVIKTLFVCFAEHPTQLSQLHPLLYHRFARLAELKTFHDHKPPAMGTTMSLR